MRRTTVRNDVSERIVVVVRTAAHADEEMWPFLISWFERADALLLGRRLAFRRFASSTAKKAYRLSASRRVGISSPRRISTLGSPVGPWSTKHHRQRPRTRLAGASSVEDHPAPPRASSVHRGTRHDEVIVSEASRAGTAARRSSCGQDL